MNQPVQARGFVAGALVATLSIYLFQKFTAKYNLMKERSIEDDPSGKADSFLPVTNDNGCNRISEMEMDSPDLPLRMIRKAESAIMRRTSRIIVVVERCTNEHNYSAILRTVEALGIQNVWLISPPKRSTEVSEHDTTSDLNDSDDADGLSRTKKIQSFTGKFINLTEAEIQSRVNHHIFAKKASEWLTIREFETTSSCLEALKKDNREVWATDLSQEAVCLTREGLSMGKLKEETPSIIPKRLAIVFGTEAVGCSNEMLTSAHRRVYLPLHGFADSLNLSVATALCLLQIFHLEPNCVGSMSESERKALRMVWYPKLATQRIMTSGQKKNRGKLVGKVKKMEEIERKRDSGVGELTLEQLEKLKTGEKYRKELEEMDAKVHEQAVKSVAHLVENPPPPLSDMRRADEHRTCYVGKNTKNKNSEFWREMPAVVNAATHDRKGITCSYFREMKADDGNNKNE